MAKLMAVLGLSIAFGCATAQAQMWDCGYVCCCDTPVIVYDNCCCPEYVVFNGVVYSGYLPGTVRVDGCCVSSPVMETKSEIVETEEPLDVIPVNVIPASVPDGGDMIDSADRVHTAQKSATDGTDHGNEANPKPESHQDESTSDKDG